MKEEEIKYTIETTNNTDELIINYPDLPVSNNKVMVDIPMTQSYPPFITDQSEEIAKLKKEIQELKDMIAEHILLGHQDK